MLRPSPGSHVRGGGGLSELRVAGVSYLNAMPVLHGLSRRVAPPRLRLEVPSVLAADLARGALDLALAPVATLASAPELEVLPRIGIGCDGPVDSVVIVSERPVAKLETLLLDSDSRTSIVLAQLIARHLRGDRPLRVQPADHAVMRDRVAGDVGAVVIGDAALRLRAHYPCVLDLGQAWREWTGLPFVFAAWVARPGVLTDEVQALLEDSLARGLAARRSIARDWSALHGGRVEDHERYLTERVRYTLDARFQRGLREFFARARGAGLLPEVRLHFAGPGA